jgi:acyl-coenzyme A thioesterase PaaI-like protein
MNRQVKERSTLVEDANRYVAHAVPRIAELGIRVVELTPDRAVNHAPLAPNVNHLGSMYAGTLFGMAEMLGGVILFPSVDFESYLPTVKEISIRYRRPALSDITAVATLDPETLTRIRDEARERGRSEYRVDATLTDTSGNVVGTTYGTYQLLAVCLTKATR